MRAIILVALLVIVAVCFADVRPQRLARRGLWRQKGEREGPRRLWRHKGGRRAVQKAQEEADSEFIGFLAPIAFNLLKNKLKRDDAEEEEADAEFLKAALKKLGTHDPRSCKPYVKHSINLDDEEEETDAEFLSKLKNWWNSKGKDLAIKGLQIYSQIKNGGAQQGDAQDE